MFFMVNRRRVRLESNTWYSPEDVANRARAEATWPRKKIFLDWGFGFEPIHTPEELHFAARLVQAYHCQDIEFDFADQSAVLEETREIEAEVERRMQADSDDSDDPPPDEAARRRQHHPAASGHATPAMQ